jgi:hypothetical protein
MVAVGVLLMAASVVFAQKTSIILLITFAGRKISTAVDSWRATHPNGANCFRERVVS